MALSHQRSIHVFTFDMTASLHSTQMTVLSLQPDSDKTINLLCESLSSDFLLKDEGDIKDFLGICISKSMNKADNSITYMMTQPGLIEQILQDIGLAPDHDDLSPPKGKFTPANAILHPYPDAAPFSAPWNYRSVIGKLKFLAQNM